MHQDALQYAVGDRIPMTLFNVPQTLGRKRKSNRNRKNKRLKGCSIEESPAIVDEGTEIGHWEVDTVVGPRKEGGAVVFTAVEKVTHDYIAIRISGRTCAGVEEAIARSKSGYGEDRFSQVFKTITVDHGTEFETFTQLESLGTKVYFAPLQLMGTAAERTSQRHPPPIYPQRHEHQRIQ